MFGVGKQDLKGLREVELRQKLSFKIREHQRIVEELQELEKTISYSKISEVLETIKKHSLI